MGKNPLDLVLNNMLKVSDLDVKITTLSNEGAGGSNTSFS